MIKKIKNFLDERKKRKARAIQLARYMNEIGKNIRVIHHSDIVLPDGSFDFTTYRTREKHKPRWNKSVTKLTPFQIYAKNKIHSS